MQGVSLSVTNRHALALGAALINHQAQQQHLHFLSLTACPHLKASRLSTVTHTHPRRAHAAS